MATIAEVRQKYPQYADMSDEQLGRALHAKYYSDIPWDQFAQKAGISTNKSPSKEWMENLQGPKPEESGLRDFLTGATGLIRGGLNAITPSDFSLGENVARMRDAKIAGTLGEQYAPPPDQTEGYGDRLFHPQFANQDSGAYLAGALLDPVAWATGIKAAQLAPYTKVLGQGFNQGVRAFGRNVAGGAIPGAIVGGLSPEGTTEGGAAIGAAANVALPPVISAVGRGVGRALTAMNPKEKAANIVREVAGSDIGGVQAAAANAPEGITATQATAGLKNDVLNALGRMVERSDRDSFFSRLTERQRQDQLDKLRRLAGGATQTEAKQATKESRRALGQSTGGMRERSLEAANQAAPPIDTNKITSSILGRIKDPKIGVSDVNSRVLRRVAAKISQWKKNGGGVIDARALYEIRKGAVNEEIERLMRGSDPKAQSRRAAALLAEIKPLIDDAIEEAGGTEWRAYLKTFEEGSQQIASQKLAAEALKMFEKSPRAFVDLVRGNAPKLVRKITGTEDDFDLAVGPEARGVFETIADDLARDMGIRKGAARGEGGLQQVLEENISRFKLPNWLSGKIAVTNRALDVLETRMNKKTMEAIRNAMKSGKNLDELLSIVPTEERNVFVRTMREISSSPYLRGGATAVAAQ